jgi:hypothetical protein
LPVLPEKKVIGSIIIDEAFLPAVPLQLAF